MKLLFVASNPEELQTLALEREITQIQQRLAAVKAASPFEFKPLPRLPVEDLLSEVTSFEPDILHVSAHGDAPGLFLTLEGGPAPALSAERFANLLSCSVKRPRLVYLNACSQASMAQVLTTAVDFAVGATAPITNRTARASAVTFYDWIARGHTVESAFNAAKAVMEAVQGDGVTIALFAREGVAPNRVRLQAVPMIVARLRRQQAGRNAGRMVTERRGGPNGSYPIEFGILGCPRDTVQLVFFTDDATFIDEEADTSYEDDLCSLSRVHPCPIEHWFDPTWDTYSGFRVYATGIRANGAAFTVVSTVAEALRTYFERGGLGDLSPNERRAVLRVIGDLGGIDV